MEKSRELLEKLMYSITTIHLDMGGNHRYALSFKSHKIITEIKGYLLEIENDCDKCKYNLGYSIDCGLPSLTSCPEMEKE